MNQENHILLVDDNPIVLTFLVTTLEQAGYSVTSTTSSKEALRLLDEQKFDLLIADLNMPELDGFDLLKNTHASLKVLIISGWADGALLPAAKAFGAAAAIKKPVSPAVLVQKVSEILAEKGCGETYFTDSRPN
jgi:CheY-like chemotaxis protein